MQTSSFRRAACCAALALSACNAAPVARTSPAPSVTAATKAIVVAERFNALDFRDPQTWKLLGTVPIPAAGVDHMDFTADGRYLLASTEYAGVVVRVDTVRMKMAGSVNVGGLPVDVKL